MRNLFLLRHPFGFRVAVLASALALFGGCRRSPGSAKADAGVTLSPELEYAIQSCPARDDDPLLLDSCPALDAWEASAIARGPGRDDELFRGLSDSRPLARLLTLRAIDRRPCPSDETCAFATNRELAERLISAAELESNEKVALEFARPIARIDAGKTKLLERIEPFIERAPERISRPILAMWLLHNPDLVPNLVRFVSSAKPHLRAAALEGLLHALRGPHRAEACAVLIEKFGEGSQYDALALTILHGSYGPNCSIAWDAFLDQCEARARGGLRLGPAPHWFYWLIDYAEDRNVTDAPIERTLSLAVKVSMDPASDTEVRRLALGYAARNVPDPAQYLDPLTRDADPDVRRRALEWRERETKLTNRRPRFMNSPRSSTPAHPTVGGHSMPQQGVPATPSPEPVAKQPSRVLVLAIAAIVATLAGLSAFLVVRQLRRRRRVAPPALRDGAELLVSTSNPLPDAPPGAVPEPSVADDSSARGPSLAPSPFSKRSRPPCHLHGIATGPDGLCALCRSAQQSVPKRRSPPSVNALLVTVSGVVFAAAVISALFRKGDTGPAWGLDTRDAPSGAAPATSVDVPDASPGKVEYVRDEKRAQSRSPRGIFHVSDDGMLSSPALGGNMRADYTCDGRNVSPPVLFANIPINAKSMSLVMNEDGRAVPSKRGERYTADPGDTGYWQLHNLPPNLAGLPEGVKNLPEGVIAPPGPNGKAGYSGPCPDGVGSKYTLWLYVFDAILDNPEKTNLIKSDHLIGIGLVETIARYHAELKIRFVDLPETLRAKGLLYRSCERDSSRSRYAGATPDCRTDFAHYRDGAFSGILSFRNDRVGLWFSSHNDYEGKDALRFEVNLETERCSRNGTVFDCSFRYADLHVADHAPPTAP